MRCLGSAKFQQILCRRCAVVIVVLLIAGTGESLSIFPREKLGVSAEANPCLYVTFHGATNTSDINTVMAYDLETGSELGQVLTDAASIGLHELRGMLLHPKDGSLLVANAWKKDSRIIQFSACQNGDGRDFVRTLVSPTSVMTHPYGMALTTSITADTVEIPLYVSSQDGTTEISWFDLVTGNPLPSQVSADPTPGALVALDDLGETRGIVVFDNYLYISREANDHVHLYDLTKNMAETGLLLLPKPIGMAKDLNARRIYVGSNDKNKPSICAFSIVGSPVVSKTQSAYPLISCVDLSSVGTHPAGLTISPDHTSLFVLMQKPALLLKVAIKGFDQQGRTAQDDAALITVMATFPTVPEQIINSPCFR